ncbi:globin domain-containing protein [Actinoplanes sp. TFC3]|uniref:globin domain-containing protein n=1 Tax=Actinoplanes sp. TFC3 TaxID=1710355 RepID=UPI0009EA2660|nr:globin domain-containing protein [Actinoplanes sp. TFC3]
MIESGSRDAYLPEGVYGSGNMPAQSRGPGQYERPGEPRYEPPAEQFGRPAHQYEPPQQPQYEQYPPRENQYQESQYAVPEQRHGERVEPPAAAPKASRGPGPNRRPDPQALEIVQRTAAVVAKRPVALAEAFYDHLFQLAPSVRDMFPADMTAQNEKLCRALLDSVRALVEPDRYAVDMERVLYRLGAQHARRYAVVPAHYPYVGHALVRAVRDVTGDWTVATSSAWIWVYDWMAAHMLGEKN